LQAALDGGSNVMLFPPENTEQMQWTEWLKGFGTTGIIASENGDFQTNGLNASDELFASVFEKIPRNIDLPKVKRYYRMQNPGGGRARSLIMLSNGDPFVTVQQIGKGNLYVSAVPLSDAWSNFQRHAIFVPIMLRMSFFSKQEFPLCAWVGEDNMVKVSADIKSGEKGLRLAKEKFEMVPEYYARNSENYISDGKQISEAGLYELKDGNGIAVQPLAFNYNRSESDLSVFDDGQLGEQLAGYQVTKLENNRGPLGEYLKKGRFGTALWKWCIWAVLLFALIEILLLRFWKTSPFLKPVIQTT
jgi:hypothetical protein